MEKTKKIKFFLSISYCLLLAIFLWLFFSNFSLNEITSYEFIKNNRNFLIEIKESNFILTTIIFIFFTIIWVFLLGFGSPVSLLGGFIFGQWIGLIIVAVSLTTGATLLYIFVNFFFKEFIREIFGKRFYNLTQKFKKNEFFYFLIYRFIGGIPFFIANILPSLFNIKIKNYFFGTLIGMIPQLFIFVSLGNGLEKIINNNSAPPSFINLITSQEIYVPIIGFLFLVLIIFFIKKKT